MSQPKDIVRLAGLIFTLTFILYVAGHAVANLRGEVETANSKSKAKSEAHHAEVSSSMDCYDFLLLGPSNTGANALASLINVNPNLAIDVSQDLEFFARDSVWSRGMKWYCELSTEVEALYPDKSHGSVLVGEHSDMYFSCPNGATRIPQALPKAKVIVTIRDPFERCLSVWSQARCEEDRRDSRTVSDAPAASSSASSGTGSAIPTFAEDFSELLWAGEGRRHSQIVSQSRNEDMHDFIGTFLEESRYGDFLADRWLDIYTLYTTDTVHHKNKARLEREVGEVESSSNRKDMLLVAAEQMMTTEGVKEVYEAVCSFLGVKFDMKKQLSDSTVKKLIASVVGETKYDGQCRERDLSAGVHEEGAGVTALDKDIAEILHSLYFKAPNKKLYDILVDIGGGKSGVLANIVKDY
eukprot:TRINITY_DN1249_c0_g1_i1.p1 TRINITY_DN1249_c0_g1~~TRINITY_DN1249_c0_g1_i1.p1  ORF type:complete len:411 (-),score=91.64 TRINITY_DN1249_c0_g1_i1:36-1268(-)